MKGQFFSRALVYFSLCMAWLTACSDESSVITNVSYSGIEAVNELEPCTIKNEKWIVFLLDSSSFYTCSKGKWIPVDLSPDYQSIKDTVVVRDTVIVKKTVQSKDTVFSYDTLVVKDTLFNKDTLISKDTVFSYDTLVVKDTLFTKDTLFSKDTVFSFDTLVVKDTLVSKDSIYSIDTVYSFDTLVVDHYDTVRVYDTTTVVFVPEYDTVTTEFLNQEMLKDGKYGILVDKRDNKVYSMPMVE